MNTASLRVSKLVVLMMYIVDISGKTGERVVGDGRQKKRKKEKDAYREKAKRSGNDVSVRAAASVIN